MIHSAFFKSINIPIPNTVFAQILYLLKYCICSNTVLLVETFFIKPYCELVMISLSDRNEFIRAVNSSLKRMLQNFEIQSGRCYTKYSNANDRPFGYG